MFPRKEKKVQKFVNNGHLFQIAIWATCHDFAISSSRMNQGAFKPYSEHPDYCYVFSFYSDQDGDTHCIL